MDINQLLRDNIKAMTPYSTARDEFSGIADVYLDANENPFETKYNRYPDPYQKNLKEKISLWQNIPSTQIFLGNGSDEIIDLLIRAFCTPGKDAILSLNPSYGMYKVSASINDVKVKYCDLEIDFSLDFNKLWNLIDDSVKIIFLCSPNNPSGNSLPAENVVDLIKKFNGIVVIDEAYIDFSSHESFKKYVSQFEHVVIMQTFSKSMAAAAIRMGMAFCSEKMVTILNRIKPPYNISAPAQLEALYTLDRLDEIIENIAVIKQERNRMSVELSAYPEVKKIYPSDANFLLIKVNDANDLYNYLLSKGIIVRNRHGQYNCDNCVRITIGIPEENDRLLQNLNEYYNAKDIVYR